MRTVKVGTFKIVNDHVVVETVDGVSYSMGQLQQSLISNDDYVVKNDKDPKVYKLYMMESMPVIEVDVPLVGKRLQPISPLIESGDVIDLHFERYVSDESIW